MAVEILRADYNNTQHAKDVVMLLNYYAQDPMGGGEALSDFTQRNLVPSLAKRAGAFTIMAYVDGQAAGLINCFEGFSTFRCMPLINIHDCSVHADYRGLGLSLQMFAKVEEVARERGCCKLTLEVLQGNIVAQNAYKKLGFAGYELDETNGCALFWEKKLA